MSSVPGGSGQSEEGGWRKVGTSKGFRSKGETMRESFVRGEEHATSHLLSCHQRASAMCVLWGAGCHRLACFPHISTPTLQHPQGVGAPTCPAPVDQQGGSRRPSEQDDQTTNKENWDFLVTRGSEARERRCDNHREEQGIHLPAETKTRPAEPGLRRRAPATAEPQRLVGNRNAQNWSLSQQPGNGGAQAARLPGLLQPLADQLLPCVSL